MREIEFRGFSQGNLFDGEKWVYGDLVCDSFNGDFNVSAGIRSTGCYPIGVNPDSVGQFTGLTDKNGVKIFEGDCGYLKNGKELMVVEWSEQGCYKIQSPKNKMHGLLFCDFDPNKFEVVGNIFQNPELIFA